MRYTTEWFIGKSKEKHGKTYDYSMTEYVRAHDPVIIICKTHGEFSMRARAHQTGQGCPECGKARSARSRRLSTADFRVRANEVHDGRYDFSQSVYVGANKRVSFICADHGEVSTKAQRVLEGKGCPRCGAFERGPVRKPAAVFEREATKLHRGFYSYYGEYETGHAPVRISCPDHGDFMQSPAAHLKGQRCPACANVERYTPERYVERVREVHGDRYEYLSPYVNAKSKIKIKCTACDLVFKQEASSHLQGRGCPACPTPISKAEQQITDFLAYDLLLEVDQQFRIGRNSFDIKVNDILIEYHGLYWHSTATIPVETEARRKHEAKRALAEEHGFRYVAIYEDEWRDNRPAVEQYLVSLFGKAKTTGARKLTVAEVTSREARAFYAKHHLLGAGAARGKHMALLDNGKIAACMSIGKASEIRGETDWYSLSRFCTDGRNIAGAASRLLKAFGDTPKLVSYIDLDKFTGDIYRTLGFTLDGYIDPDYMTVWPGAIRKHKTSTRKDRLAKLPGFNAELTEFANCEAMGIHRIYHSGRMRVVRYTTPR